eukprot:7387460-Prymnesium_polylepis.2
MPRVNQHAEHFVRRPSPATPFGAFRSSILNNSTQIETLRKTVARTTKGTVIVKAWSRWSTPMARGTQMMQERNVRAPLHGVVPEHSGAFSRPLAWRTTRGVRWLMPLLSWRAIRPGDDSRRASCPGATFVAVTIETPTSVESTGLPGTTVVTSTCIAIPS